MRVNVDKPDEKDERISDWKPRYLVQKAPGVSGDLIQRDEPVLVIRAQDSLAGSMITYYLSLYEKLDNADPKVIEDMLDHQEALVEWQDHNRDRIKTADR